MTAQRDPRLDSDTVASLGEEVKLLVDMVVEHSAPWLEGVVAAGHRGRADGEPAPSETTEQRTDAGETGGWESARERGFTCGGWCPLCAIVAVARGERPELSARALEQAAHLIALLRAVLADRWYPSDGVHMPGFRPDSGVDKEAGEHLPPLSTMNGARSTGTRPNGAPRVQHIPVRKVGVREAGEP